MRLLVTRPEPEGERTAALLRSRGHEVVLAPLLRIESVDDAALGAGPWQAALFTSANAVRAIAAHRRFGDFAGLPAYVVGARTQAAATAAGFDPVRSADPALSTISSRWLRQGSRTPRSRSSTSSPGSNAPAIFAGALQSLGLQVETAVVYRLVAVANLAPELRGLLAAGRIDAVLHYSARSASAPSGRARDRGDCGFIN